MKIGNYQVYGMICDTMALDGGAMFGIIPKPMWEKILPPDEKNRIPMANRSMVIIGNGRKILVDTGIGDKVNPKFSAIYQQKFLLQQNMELMSIKPEEITDVILTHLHFDHVGGATKIVDGKIVPTFPNATYYVQAEHYEWANSKHERERASFKPENFVPLFEQGKLKLLQGNTKLFDGIDVMISNGHTVALQMVKITGEKKVICMPSDLMPTFHHINPLYVMAYDIYPMALMEEKKKFLEQAMDENWVLMSCHDAHTEAIDLKRGEKGYERGNIVRL